MKKFLTILLCVALLISIVPTALAVGSENAITVHTTFYEGVILKSNVQYSMDADYTWFNNPSSAYNHKLAQLSMMLATSAFKKETKDLTECDEYLQDFFEESGFTGYEAYDYDVVRNIDTIANAFAYKKMNDEKGEYYLLAIPICGQGYGDEWLSNFSIGNEEEHTGFTGAAEKVYERLQDYIQRNFEKERIKLWITGFSRSAAVSNVLSHLILSSNQFEPDNVFAYTFATPNTTMYPVEYPQLFCICNGHDGIPKVPMAEWGYTKHGIIKYLPTQSTRSDFNEVAEPAQEIFAELTENPDAKITLPERNWLLNQILSIAGRYIPDAQTYANGYQEAISAAWVAPGSVFDKLDVLITTAEKNKCDTSGFNNIKNDLEALASGALNYSVDVITMEEEDSVWTDIFSSGKELVHEHFPLVYLSWLFSTDDASKLFCDSDEYNQILFTGYPDVLIYHVNRITAEEELIYDSSNGIAEIPVVMLADLCFVDLPITDSYKLIMKPNAEQDPVSVMYSNKNLKNTVFPISETRSITLYEDENEFIEVSVPSYAHSNSDVEVKLNGSFSLPFRSTDLNTLSKKLMNKRVSNSFLSFLSSLIELLPDLIGFAILLISALVIFIKRLIRGPVDDRVECSKAGKVLLIFAAVIAGIYLVLIGGTLVLLKIINISVSSSQMFQRISEILTVSFFYYLLYIFITLILTIVLSIRSIRHRLSRRRFLALSIMMLLFNIVSFAVAMLLSTPSYNYIYFLFEPVLSIIATVVAGRKKTVPKPDENSSL